MRGLILIAVVALAGCASPSRYESMGRGARTMVSIENHNWADARIYAVSPHLGRIRLATVGTETRTTVPLPRAVDRYGESVGFEVELIASRESFTIAPVMVAPGAVMRIQVENHLALTNIMLTD